MNNGSILIISDDLETGRLISEKVKLLRNYDNIQTVTYIEAISVLNSTQPFLIMVYGSNEDSIAIVKEIRTLTNLDKVPIILVTDSFDEDLLLCAFDNGIDDFFFLDDADSIILMRIFLTIRKSMLYKQIDIKNDILVTAGIVDKTSGIYTEEKAPLALKNFFSKSIEENMGNTVFMCIKPVAIFRKKLNIHNIAGIIKTVPRGDDVVAFGKNSTFYLILYNTGINGAKSVFSRIKQLLEKKCNIYAAAAEITTSFEEMEPVLSQSLNEQISSNIDFNYLYNLALSEKAEIIDIHDENGKKFKDFKKEFYSAFEKIVTPVFYQMKITASNKFKKSKVNFDITETESVFTITKDNLESKLLITYPSYMKVLIDIKHTVNEEKTKSRRLSFDFEDFSSEKLLSIIQDVLKEFEVKLNKKRTEN